MKIYKDWDWLDFGFMFRIYTTNKICDYKLVIDIQFFWLNIWISTFKKY
jgi:hypothetical protein